MRTPGRSKRPPVVLAATTMLFLAAGPRPLPAADSSSEVVVGAFTQRLERALGLGAGDWDRLWAPGARDSTRRRLDLRASALFEWTDVSVVAEDAVLVREGEAEHLDVIVVVTGTATWEARAWGVAQAFCALQTDERSERNRVVRREAWRLAPTTDGWPAVDRVLLSPVEIVEGTVEAGIYPGQDALLVNCVFYVRALVDGAQTLRFLLDGRSYIYRLEVDGAPVEFVRGSETGSLGLEGFAPALESSLRFERPLVRGEELLVKVRLRSPLVHLRGEGFVTTLPLGSGAFRERAWYPILPPPGWASSTNTTGSLSLTVRWPRDGFEEVALSGTPEGEAKDDPWFEERALRATGVGPRAADFVLGEPGVKIEALDWSGEARVRGAVVGRVPGNHAGLDPDPRSRGVLVGALVAAASYSSRDLDSEIQELLPLDAELYEDPQDAGDDSSGEADGDQQG